jgi:hypothetical protein
MTQKIFVFSNNFDVGIKNAKFYAVFESIENVAKSLHEESYKAENFCTQYLYIFFLQYIQYIHTII